MAGNLSGNRSANTSLLPLRYELPPLTDQPTNPLDLSIIPVYLDPVRKLLEEYVEKSNRLIVLRHLMLPQNADEAVSAAGFGAGQSNLIREKRISRTITSKGL
jgi:hypothetical protein